MSLPIAEQARIALRRHVTDPLVARCIDHEFGGFLVDFDEQWRPAGPHEKTLEHAARTTAAFGLMHRACPGEGYDALVRHGCAFLQGAFWDSTHGGLFAKVDRGGHPCWEGLKHPHAVTYAAEAFLLAEPCLPPGDSRLWANRCLAWMNDVAWDPIHGGYWGTYRRDNERYADDARLPTLDGLDPVGVKLGFKEINTFGDAIEMLTEFAAREDSKLHRARLAQLVDLLVHQLSDSTGMLPFLYRRDWRPVPDLIRVGQQFQTIHRLLAASEFSAGLGPSGRSSTAEIVERAREFADFCLATARHPSGGFCTAVSANGRVWPTAGPSSDQRQWWIQLEAVRAFHALAIHESVDAASRARYESARDQQWTYLSDYFFDNRHGGIWESPVDPAARRNRRLKSLLGGKSEPMRKMHGWKDPLHEVGVFLALAQTEPGSRSTASPAQAIPAV